MFESGHSNDGNGHSHWAGNAVDFQIVHGKAARPATNTTANLDTDKAIMQACVAAGAIPTQVFGPCTNDFAYSTSFKLCPYTGFNTNIDHSNHVHCAW